MKRVIHADRYPAPGSPDTYQATATACAPAGSLTRAGWQRMYLTTSQPSLVTCRRCSKEEVVTSTCDCMTEDPGDGYGERVVTHSLRCPLHPEHPGRKRL